MKYKNIEIGYWIYYWILMGFVKYHRHKDLIKAWAVCILAGLAVWLWLAVYYG